MSVLHKMRPQRAQLSRFGHGTRHLIDNVQLSDKTMGVLQRFSYNISVFSDLCVEDGVGRFR